VICESSSVEEVHVDDEGDVFRVRYETISGVNRVTVIDDYENDGINKKVIEARTLYKRKKDKILPANQPHTGGLKPGGDEDWKSKLVGNPSPMNPKYPWLITKFSGITRGTRLTSERNEEA